MPQADQQPRKYTNILVTVKIFAPDDPQHSFKAIKFMKFANIPNMTLFRLAIKINAVGYSYDSF